MRHTSFLLQDLVVLLVVGLALAYVLRRLTRNAKGHADCGCGHCGAESGPAGKPSAGPPAPSPAGESKAG